MGLHHGAQLDQVAVRLVLLPQAASNLRLVCAHANVLVQVRALAGDANG